MGQPAPRVAIDREDVDALERRVLELADEAQVEIDLVDGGRIRGTVAVRPSAQVFVDGRGSEGINGTVRIDDAVDPSHAHFIWLTDIAAIRKLGSA